MRCETFGLALSDSVTAIQIDPAYLKAYYRRAAAQMSLGKFKNALQDLEHVSRTLENIVAPTSFIHPICVGV